MEKQPTVLSTTSFTSQGLKVESEATTPSNVFFELTEC